MKKNPLITAIPVIGLAFSLSLAANYCTGVLDPAPVYAVHTSAPTVTAINPSNVPNDLDVTIVITGTGFVAVPTVSLGNVTLTDIGWVSSNLLTATVPWGMQPGSYTLTVTNPDGHSGYLHDALVVTQGIGVWTSDGPYGGAVTAILVNPMSPTILYATVHDYCTPWGSGLFRSLDGGMNWEAILRDTGARLHAVDLSAPSPSIIYAYKWSEGLYRSDNGGDTWTVLPMPSGIAGDIRPYAHPTDPDVVYAVMDCDAPTCSGVYRSSDRGEHWVSRSAGITDTHITAMAFDLGNPQIMYIGTRQGNVFRSNNEGNNWSFLGRPDDFIGSLAVNPFGSHEVWVAAADNGGHWGYLWRHVGGDWVQVLPGVGNENRATTIVFHPTIPGLMWIGTLGGSLKSTDGGSTWTFVGPSAQDVLSLAIDLDNTQALYIGYGGIGIHKTTDGGVSWVESNRGLAGICINGLAMNPSNPAIVYATAHGPGTFRSDNGGHSWRRLLPTNYYPRTPAVDPLNPARAYIGQTNSIWITEDDGLTWTPRESPEPPPQYSHCCRVELLSLLPTGQPGHLVMGVGFIDTNSNSYTLLAGGIYTSTNYGETWGYVDVGQVISPVTVLVSDPNNRNTIYAGTGERDWFGGTGVWKSEDGGATWSPSGLSGLQITGLAVDPLDSQVVYATSLRQFYISTDGGANWTLRDSQDVGLEKLVVLPTMPPTIYRYGWAGTIRSTDSGLNWMREDDLLGDASVSVIAVTKVEGRIVLYVGIVGSMRLIERQGQIQTVTSAASDSLNAGVYRKTYLLREHVIFLPLVQR